MGVNKYRLEKEAPVEVLSIDNTATIQSQVGGACCQSSVVMCTLIIIEEEIARSL